MQKFVFHVDFNEMLEANLVLLSAGDEKLDDQGKIVLLREGLEVTVLMEDFDVTGRVDSLVAIGVVEQNRSDASWGRHVKWCCRIDNRGIRHQSEI
jgi:hypothetical protein